MSDKPDSSSRRTDEGPLSQNLVAVDPAQLNGLGLDQERYRRFIARQNTADINLVEFFHAASHFPVAFTRNGNEYRPCVVTGLADGENLFVDEHGQWQDAVYCPASLRRYPFVTMPVMAEELSQSPEQLQKPVFVDEDALVESQVCYFIGNGVETEQWRQMSRFIADFITAEHQTLRFTQKLARLKLLEAFDAQIHPNQGDNITLKGLYRVNENRLNALSGSAVKDLMQSGWLSRIYAHLISLEHFAQLLDRRAARLQRQPAPRPQ